MYHVCTLLWYVLYQAVVLAVPTLGTRRTKRWYSLYRLLVSAVPKVGIAVTKACCRRDVPCLSLLCTGPLSENVQSVRKRTLFFFVLTLVFNDLHFWHGFRKYKDEESRLSVYVTGRRQYKTVNKDREYG